MITREAYGEWLDTDKNIFYYVLLQNAKTRTRYLKIGISSRSIKRFRDADYQKYSVIKPLYIAECDCANATKDLEDLNRTILRNTKGLTFIDNDRFRYFLLPKTLPRCEKFGEYVEIRI